MSGEGKSAMWWSCQDDLKDGLRLVLDESGNIEVYGPGPYTAHTPAQAREIAAALLRMADEAEKAATR